MTRVRAVAKNAFTEPPSTAPTPQLVNYVVNRDGKKIEGPFGGKICTKIEK